MTHVLVVVHGMGTNEGSWATSIVDNLNAVARRYAVFSGAPAPFVLASGADDPMLDAPNHDRIVVVPAGYDAEMRARVESFDRDVNAVLDAAGAGGLPKAMVDVLKALDGAGETEKNFFWTHVVDVLLYHFFALVTKPVRLAVMETLGRVLARHDTDVSVMAHSLGTAVAHDALTTLARGLFPDFAALRPPGVRIANYFAIANVSRVLEQPLAGDVDVYLSPVCPISVRGVDAYCRQFFNFRHMLDPFTVPKRFEPHWVEGDDFFAVEHLLHVADFNVHGWEHYLDNPEVHVPILNALADVSGWDVVDKATFDTAVASYRAAPVPLCEHGMAWWTEQTHRIQKRLELKPTVPELIRTGAQFLAVAAGAKALCRGEQTLAQLAPLAGRIG